MILQHEGTIRLTAFVGVFAAMAVWELLSPKKTLAMSRAERWGTNLAIIVVDTVMLRVLFPILAVGVAAYVHARGWGLFGLLGLSGWFEIILSVVLLDMAIYWQHVFSHRIGMLWRFHQVHHADRSIDVSTALRFHPVEIGLSMLYKFAVIFLIGPSAVAVFLFEVILNASAMFNHGNVRLPQPIDKLLRAVIVTPDMHRVHHSIVVKETHSNFGFFMSIWDRLFGTYIAQPREGHDGMIIGLPEYQGKEPAHFLWALALPFRKQKGEEK
ncbi:MAG: sterol desaturase family protein [Parvularcula sp.]